MKIIQWGAVAAALSVTLGIVLAPAASADGPNGLNAVGLISGTELVTFGTQDTTAGVPVTVTGLQADSRLVGIDYRPRNGKLYGVGDGKPAGAVPILDPAVNPGIYTIDPDTGVATLVGRLSTAVNGSNFGVDFNPAADALRIVSNRGANVRQPFQPAPPAAPNTGDAPVGPTVVDGDLTLDGDTQVVTGAAYTNNDNDPATGTELFDIVFNFRVDPAKSLLALQNPPNDGTLTEVGPLGAPTSADAGFDIFNGRKDGKKVTNAAFATLSGDGVVALYAIDLKTGEASAAGTFDKSVIDLAIKLDQNPN